MGIHYGFDLWKKREDGEVDERYNKLNESDKKFYHDALPFLLLGCDIGFISKETIPIIVERDRFKPLMVPGFYEKVKEACKGGFAEYLERFIGYRTNISSLCKTEWYFKMMRIAQEKNPTKKDMDDLELKFIKDEEGRTPKPYKRESYKTAVRDEVNDFIKGDDKEVYMMDFNHQCFDGMSWLVIGVRWKDEDTD